MLCIDITTATIVTRDSALPQRHDTLNYFIYLILIKFLERRAQGPRRNNLSCKHKDYGTDSITTDAHKHGETTQRPLNVLG
jgi:hypothetical protein